MQQAEQQVQDVADVPAVLQAWRTQRTHSSERRQGAAARCATYAQETPRPQLVLQRGGLVALETEDLAGIRAVSKAPQPARLAGVRVPPGRVRAYNVLWTLFELVTSSGTPPSPRNPSSTFNSDCSLLICGNTPGDRVLLPHQANAGSTYPEHVLGR